MVGWINIAGWLTLITTEAFFSAQFISAAAVVGSNGAYEVAAWKTYLIFLAVFTFAILLNIYGYRILNRWNEFARKKLVPLCTRPWTTESDSSLR